MAHEDLDREHHIEGSSDRSFALVFVIVFTLIAAWPLLAGQSPRWWAAGIATGLAAIAGVRPSVLAPLNRLWLRFGLILGNIVSPIALGILFYGVISPTGVVMRWIGKDPLRLNFDDGLQSYWIAREPPGPPPTSMTNQF